MIALRKAAARRLSTAASSPIVRASIIGPTVYAMLYFVGQLNSMLCRWTCSTESEVILYCAFAQTLTSRMQQEAQELTTARRCDHSCAYADAAKALIADSSNVKAVVVSGEGRAFCAGLDIKSLMAEPLKAKANMEALLERPEGEVSNLAQDVGYLWRRIPCPVITAIHGVCFGGGLQIALGADIRIAHPQTKLSVMEAKWGLIPDMSATVTLPELVPKDVAMELTMSGRIFDGSEALKLGLVTKLSEEPEKAAMDLARKIASTSPDAAAAAKRLLHATYTDAPDDARALRLESKIQRKLLGGWNQGVMVAKGLGAPSFLQPGFATRSTVWDEEADEQAEAEIRAMLDGLSMKSTSSAN